MFPLKIFDFDPSNYDFWPLYEAIRKYYPLGLNRHEHGAYFKFEGYQEYVKIIAEKIHDDENFQRNWEIPARKWAEVLSYPYKGTTYGSVPSYSGSYILESAVVEPWSLTVELHVAVSLLGHFYTVYILESCFAVGAGGSNLRATVVPYGKHKSKFEHLIQLIRDDYPSYKFVPYQLYSCNIPGLITPHRNELENTLYHGLFNNIFPFNTTILPRFRDMGKFGFTEWLKK